MHTYTGSQDVSPASLGILLSSFQCSLAPPPPTGPSGSLAVVHLTVHLSGQGGCGLPVPGGHSTKWHSPKASPQIAVCVFSSFAFCCSRPVGPSSFLSVGVSGAYPDPLSPERGALVASVLPSLFAGRSEAQTGQWALPGHKARLWLPGTLLSWPPPAPTSPACLRLPPPPQAPHKENLHAWRGLGWGHMGES